MTSSSVPDFPKLTINDIMENITFGSYQVEQAQSYIKENFKSLDNSLIELYDGICKTFINLINHANNAELVTKNVKNNNISFIHFK